MSAFVHTGCRRIGPHRSHRRGHATCCTYEFLTAAGREPRLRALYPFTSHHDLGVRRCADSVITAALPATVTDR